MVSITLSVSPEIRMMMKRFPEINWSGFIKGMINRKVKELAWRDEMLKKAGQEEEIDEWAVNLVRNSRKGRLAKLRRAGVVG